MTHCEKTASTSPAPAPSLAVWITTFIHRQRYRQAALKNMRRLSDRELHDIGIDRRDITALVDREMSRMRTDEFRSRF